STLQAPGTSLMISRTPFFIALAATLIGGGHGLAHAADPGYYGLQSAATESVPALQAVERKAYYVRYGKGRRSSVEALVRGRSGEVTHRLDSVDTMAVLLPEAAAQAMATHADIALVEPVPEHKLLAQVVPWNIDQFQARDIWDKDRDGNVDGGAPNGSGVKFCIIDTGF